MLVDVSCSGATTAAVTQAQTTTAGTAPPQIDAVTEDTDLITVSIGGNDSLLSLAWLKQCTQLAPADPEGSPCADANSAGDSDPLLDLVPGMKDNLGHVIDLIKERAPNATVIVVNYPKPFPDRGTCELASLIAAGDLKYVNSIVEAVSTAMIEAAKEANVDWVDVHQASRGHDVCARVPWVNGFTSDQSRANVLHPFPEEQAAVASMILSIVRGQLGAMP